MMPPMFQKSFRILLALAAGVGAATAGPALSGIKVLESQPYAATAKVVEIRGERGAPQPQEWIYLLSDSSARGGVREVVMTNGKITSERTPLRGLAELAGHAPLDASALATDADAIFQTVHKEATRAELGFDWIDYTLRADPDSREPLWTVKLYDRMGAPVGTMRLSARKGTVVDPLQPDPDARARAQATPISRGAGILDNVGRAAGRAAKSTSDSALYFLGTLQEEIVGERTIGPKEKEE